MSEEEKMEKIKQKELELQMHKESLEKKMKEGQKKKKEKEQKKLEEFKRLLDNRAKRSRKEVGDEKRFLRQRVMFPQRL